MRTIDAWVIHTHIPLSLGLHIDFPRPDLRPILRKYWMDGWTITHLAAGKKRKLNPEPESEPPATKDEQGSRDGSQEEEEEEEEEELKPLG